MGTTAKPTLRLESADTWSCTDGGIVRFGPTPKDAYDRWLVDSLREALRARPQKQAAPAVVAPAAAPRTEPAESVRRPASRPAVKPNPRAMTVKPARTEPAPKPPKVPVGMPSYPESMVRQCPGTAPRREYVPPAGLLDHQRAAARVQPSFVSMASRVTDFKELP